MSLERIIKNVKTECEKYLIDTSAKIIVFTPLMATLEAYKGLELTQIIESRAGMALIDLGAARVYTKLRDKIKEKVEPKNRVSEYLVNTLPMIAVYSPIYAGLLAASGASYDQGKALLISGTIIVALTAQPFAKYFLIPWRKYWTQQDLTEKLAYRKV